MALRDGEGFDLVEVFRESVPFDLELVPALPRTAQEILDHADELAARFETHEPGDDIHEATELRLFREAFVARADAERALGEAVVRARHDGHSWASIGAMVGISGEAARQRYGQSVNASQNPNDCEYRALHKRRTRTRA